MDVKKQIIEELTSTIEENSLYGKLTRTLHVGSYNYKSGYDTIFAIGYNENKKPIAYSYYQNDRGEMLDSPTYKLENLDIDVLKELKENLGKHTDDADDYCRYTNAEAKNMRFITHLGLYTQQNIGKVDFHINELKELGKYGLYALDLFGNVSRAIYLGSPLYIEGELYYIENDDNVVLVENHKREKLLNINEGCGKEYQFCKVEGIHPLYRHLLFKNSWGIHGIYEYRMFSSKKCLKELEDILNSPNAIKYAVFQKSLRCHAFTVYDSGKFEGTSATIFNNKIDAENFFNEKRKEHIAVVNKCVTMYENALKNIQEEIDQIHEDDKKEYLAKYKDLEIGKTYYLINGMSKVIYDEYVTPTKYDETYGLFYQGNKIISPFHKLVEESNVKKYERADEKETLTYRTENLDNNIKTLKALINSIENFIPFVSENDDFEVDWLVDRTISIIKANYDY